MIKLFQRLFTKQQPVQLKDVNKVQFKEQLINFNYSNVGTYNPGSRTKTVGDCK